MSLRPYWARHRIQLRIAGALVLLLSPLIVIMWAGSAAWNDRQCLIDELKDGWWYMTRGREPK